MKSGVAYLLVLAIYQYTAFKQITYVPVCKTMRLVEDIFLGIISRRSTWNIVRKIDFSSRMDTYSTDAFLLHQAVHNKLINSRENVRFRVYPRWLPKALCQNNQLFRVVFVSQWRLRRAFLGSQLCQVHFQLLYT